ncbi:MAG: hypothetical protein ACFCVF_14615 [Kineosporiaceae bacterium]
MLGLPAAPQERCRVRARRNDQLPRNERAEALGARPDWHPRHALVLLGGVLVAGAACTGSDTDVSAGVLDAAQHHGPIAAHQEGGATDRRPDGGLVDR